MASSLWEPIFLSLKLAFGATIIVLIFGLAAAKWMTAYSFKGKLLVELLFLLPIVLPPTVVGFILIVLLGGDSILGRAVESIFGQPLMFSQWAALISATVVSFPLMYQSLSIGFQEINQEIIQAARLDRASWLQILIYIELPLIWKAVIAGVFLSFARALGEFGATLMFAGNIPGKTQTTAIAIYMAMESGDMKTAWTLVIVLMSISFVLLFVVQMLKKKSS
ncbi:molybdate ABC transporter permease subunit [Bacillus smithii]|uniref:Molybdenum transport system permease n=1 Tax=Bacillus smithii 7_3_47FAA TaxID=665952 RepID=G9QIW8_9BACI|nr:molybdate ABC transporter permease subunit [Bacillus smithii]EHL78890.1 molybdate ABC transporter, permease [Bacillus smithii 7_3_47FAA]